MEPSRLPEILLVDDDKIVCLLQHKILCRLLPQVKISSFQNGQEAIDYLSRPELQERGFLILLDINMPVMNGWEFLEEYRTLENSQICNVCMLTSSINPLDKARACSYPQVCAFLEKPFTSEKATNLLALPEIEELFGEYFRL